MTVTIEADSDGGADEQGRRSPRVWLAGVVVVASIVALLVVLTQRGDPEVLTDDPTLTGTAAETLADGSARVLIDVEDDGVHIQGRMSFGPDGRGRFELSDAADPNAIGTMIALPDATYVEFDGFWVPFTNEEFSADSGYRLGTDRNEFLAIVQLFVESLDHATPASVRDVGTDVVRGTEVRVVAADIDIREAIRSSSVEIDLDAFDASVPDFGSDLVVMLDERGRARRVSLSGGEEDVTIELWDFGVEVDVEAPAADGERGLLEQRVEKYDELHEENVETTADYCALVVEFRPMLTATARPSTPSAWSRAAEQMTEIDDGAPIETMTWTGVLTSAYRSVAAALEGGAELEAVMAGGVDTEYGLLDWQTVRDAERGFVEVTASICN